jgi:hypothetical protein
MNIGLTTLIPALAISGLGVLGICLTLIPGRCTRLLNEAFYIVPVVGGRHHLLKRAIATAIGLTLVYYVVYLAGHDFQTDRTMVTH